MSDTGIQPISAAATATQPVASERLDRHALSALQALGRPLDSRDPAVIRFAAGQLVSELFLRPLLAEMRSFSFGAKFAHGGYAESVFAEQLDQQIADAVAASDRGGLVDQIAERLQAFAPRQDTDGSAAVSWKTQLQVQQASGDAQQ